VMAFLFATTVSIDCKSNVCKIIYANQ
jgi:hypothetical protein